MTRLFEGETTSDVLAAVLRAEPDWSELPAETPSPVVRLLHRLLPFQLGQAVVYRMGTGGTPIGGLQDGQTKTGRERKEIRDINYYHCKGCGLCAAECPRGAMAMSREES